MSYRERVFDHLAALWPGQAASALDFGSGDGWFAAQVLKNGLAAEVTPVDVLARKKSVIAPVVYAGGALPYADRQFDVVYAVDSLHHTDDPAYAIGEMMRCSARWVIVKDHVAWSQADRWLLALLDEWGNRRFGVRSTHRYQNGWEWRTAFERGGFRLETMRHPAPCVPKWIAKAVDRLQFAALWRRVR